MSRIQPMIFYPKPQMTKKGYDIFYYINEEPWPMSEEMRVDGHNHKYYELYAFVSGAVDYTIDGITYPLRPGDVLLMRPGQIHGVKVHNFKIPYERYVLWITADYLKKLSSDETNLALTFANINFIDNYLRTSPEMFRSVTRLLQMILAQRKVNDYGSELLTDAYIAELLINVTKAKIYQRPVITGHAIEENDLITRTISYISDHIGERLSIEEITNALYVSKSHLSKLFTNTLGITIYQYIIKKRLFLAKQELLAGVSAETVSESYGFGNYSSFYRAFVKEFGSSPTEYVKKEMKNHSAKK